MAQEVKHVNVCELREVPAWKGLVEEVRTTKRSAIIGIADVKETDIAENHNKYLADAYADTHE